MDEYDEVEKAYLDMIEPKKLVEGMSYDDFVDWVEIGTREDIECAIRVFKNWGLNDHVRVMEIVLERETYKKV